VFTPKKQPKGPKTTSNLLKAEHVVRVVSAVAVEQLIHLWTQAESSGHIFFSLWL